MSHVAFCQRVIEQCRRRDAAALVYNNGGVLNVCYEGSARYERFHELRGSSAIIGTYDQRASAGDIVSDVDDYFSQRDRLNKSWEDNIDPSLDRLVDSLLIKLHHVSGPRLAALKEALRPFNIQHQRWYERSGS